MWDLLANILAQPRVADYLIKRAMRTPYSHIDGYMNRYWLAPYEDERGGEGCGSVVLWKRPLAALLQAAGYAVRIHHILREDLADHLHDHPWNARTVILKGRYTEHRRYVRGLWIDHAYITRLAGDTATIDFGEFHKITEVSEGGVWTLFITKEYKGTWGFLVNGRKVPWREYEGRN